MTYHIHYKRMRYSFATAEAQAAFKQGLYAAIESDTVYDFLLNAQYDNAQPSDAFKKTIKLP